MVSAAVEAFPEEVVQVGAGRFLNPEEEKVLVSQISQVELTTTGEICIHTAKKTKSKSPIDAAISWFHKLGVDRTQDRNGVLIYVSVQDHQVAIIGDKAIHEILGDDGWQKIVGEIIASFKKGDYLVGLQKAVEEVGSVLRRHFPSQLDRPNANELPNALSKSD